MERRLVPPVLPSLCSRSHDPSESPLQDERQGSGFIQASGGGEVRLLLSSSGYNKDISSSLALSAWSTLTFS
ncbi:hypothetical protein EYF80_045526 [Liparis tanakae]|uniref:Uncharacterized protein n=1 Tax=Liparis tanakae TaxID=230148 RepID=A0A4Z2FTF1_9TELE|nr:hypothetical protein EYF80_045526 [Liparis tanakae]